MGDDGRLPRGLELTWTNKHERLLARDDGGYTRCPRSDYRVAEVRLLRDAGTTGETHPDAERAKDNLMARRLRQRTPFSASADR